MRARSRLRVDGAGRVVEMTEDPPVAWRRTPDAVYLVGTAGGLTGDDDVTLEVDVAAGACLAVRSGAATVVYTGTGTRQRTSASVGTGGLLDWAPQPVIVTAGASHVQEATVRLGPGAELDWTELVVLGRSAEAPGRAEMRLDCTLVAPPGSDRPLLRHQLSVGPGAPGWAGPAVLGPNRAVGLRLRAGPTAAAPPVRHGEGWAWLALDGPGWMLSAVAPDLPTLLARMTEAGGPPARLSLPPGGARVEDVRPVRTEEPS